ncbi:RimK family alpha-L-glutamate ligase [Thiocapsa imhoffii]|uniref:RimK family alpha-L-glutamate ligase n=1 Tax=Thiocapsa imhoffii TaxID=382777 RepID=A0A9X1BBG9_9GAMM|nr:RimK family protein [Thiocapsa imhoffii]MBK1646655.1 RimK family alpha-L-glutamate ligase [Thiocapsa imhoffii]
MAEHLLLVEHQDDWKPGFPTLPVVTAREYLASGELAAKRDLRVINLCRSDRYLSVGYYCSLLAEARGHKIIPTVRTLQELSSRELYSLATEELDALVQRLLGRRHSGALVPTAYELIMCFGQCDAKELQPLAREIFETFRCPILRVEFRRQGTWRIGSIKALSLTAITSAGGEGLLFSALEGYLSQRWRQPRARLAYRYDLAVLHDPTEDLPPSDGKALKRFVKAGKALGVNVELIQRKDYSRLAEYDALFIRETTRIGHHTFRFAKKADSEGMVVIDDPDSILRCTNKVYLAELLAAHRILRPKTLVLRRENLLEAEALIGYPVVLKIPEGSFSRGVFRADDRAGLKRIAANLFKQSDLILAQEYLYTPFDWRIGILGRQPFYACKYFMSRDHWQIVKHEADGRHEQGEFETLPIEAVPTAVIKTALKAAGLIGDGLYGVDLKETPAGPVVIEVNDNPSLDAGIEDQVLGDALYTRVIAEFVKRLDQRRIAKPRPC